MRFLWIPATGCKVIADFLAVMLIYNYYDMRLPFQSPNFWFDYFWAVPFFILSVIIFSVWSSSSWKHATYISTLFVANMFLCFLAGGIIGFWNNPWLVVSGWLWIIAVGVCLVVRYVRSLFSHPRQQEGWNHRLGGVRLVCTCVICLVLAVVHLCSAALGHYTRLQRPHTRVIR